MDTEDRKLTLLALGIAIGGGYLVKVALDQLLGAVPASESKRPAVRLAAPLGVSLAATGAFLLWNNPEWLK